MTSITFDLTRFIICRGKVTECNQLQWRQMQFRPPCKLKQNGYVKSFNGMIRDELLNEILFFSLNHAMTVVAEWVEDYNAHRPHSALAYQTPAAFPAKLTATRLNAALTDGSA